MALELCILASGSSGNATLVRTARTALLIDAGISLKRIAAACAAVEQEVSALHGVCLSHEHSDHVAGLPQLSTRHNIPVFANQGTAEALSRSDKFSALSWRIFANGSPFQIGDITVEPFSVPHDAYDPVGFLLSAGHVRVAVVTDMGMATALVRRRLQDCHALVLESNHDEWMVQQSSRPWSLKQRILGRQGHLSNQRAGELAVEVAGPQLQHIFLAHLSSDCNEPGVALTQMRRALDEAGHLHVRVSLTHPDKPSEVWRFIPAPPS